MNLNKLDKFHKTRTGYLVFGLIELSLAYLFVSLAIDSGSLFQYALTLLLAIGFLQNFVKLIGALIHGNKHKPSRA